ncbi:MAG: AAA family ATPase, partial [Cyclobacteriaceae bacterium]|nr:AAA family ATPase [Cyclobacteriaceae bacterium]
MKSGNERKDEAINWLWRGRLAKGCLSILAGQAGTGKSTLSLSIAASITCGGVFPDKQQAVIGKVAVVNLEDGYTFTTKPRLKAAGADLDRIYENVTIENGNPFDLANSDHVGALQQFLLEAGGVDLLIVDPIVMAVSGDSHKAAEVRRGLQSLVTLAGVCNCCVLGITHFTKNSTGGEPLDRVLGSGAFGQLARTVLATVKDNKSADGRHLLTLVKSNISRAGGGVVYFIKSAQIASDKGETIETSKIEYGEVLDGEAFELINHAEQRHNQEGETKQEKCERWLIDLLQRNKNQMQASDIKALAIEENFTEGTLKRAASQLCHFEKIKGFHAGTLWRLKTTHSSYSKYEPCADTERPNPSTGAVSSTELTQLITHSSNDDELCVKHPKFEESEVVAG